MKVKLINYTSDAKNLLLFTKNTRLMNEDNAYAKIKDWPEDKKQAELDYMHYYQEMLILKLMNQN